MATERGGLATHFQNPRALVLGDNRRRTAAVLLAGCALVAVSAAVDYGWHRALLAGRTAPWTLSELRSALALSSPWGYALVVALTAASAFANRGFLPTLALGAASSLGDSLIFATGVAGRGDWVDASIAFGFRPYSFTSHPPKVLICTTAGFAVGLLARRYLWATGANS